VRNGKHLRRRFGESFGAAEMRGDRFRLSFETEEPGYSKEWLLVGGVHPEEITGRFWYQQQYDRVSVCLSFPLEPEHRLVHVTPAPVLAGLGRANDRVAGRVVVRGRVLAGRAVAAADVSAALAHPQVDPAHPLLQALLASGDLGGQVDVLDRVDVRTDGGRSPTLAHRRRRVRTPRAVTRAICNGERMSGVNGGGEPITQEGIAALREEIERLEGSGRTEMAARIKVAREEGDLKENAEYHIAKEDQAHLETKIKRLRERLRTAVVVEVDGGADRFAFGRTAEVFDEEKGAVLTWTLVGSTEADLAEGRLSAESPIGQALMNAEPGKPVEVETPRGSRTFVVQKLLN
jgi:transcription elongation factor GreA